MLSPYQEVQTAFLRFHSRQSELPSGQHHEGTCQMSWAAPTPVFPCYFQPLQALRPANKGKKKEWLAGKHLSLIALFLRF
jgi:hypothetical protein